MGINLIWCWVGDKFVINFLQKLFETSKMCGEEPLQMLSCLLDD